MSAGFGKHPVCLSGRIRSVTREGKSGHVLTTQNMGDVPIASGASSVTVKLDGLVKNRSRAYVCGYPRQKMGALELLAVVALAESQVR